jgi:hypothetical protein
LLYCGAFLKCRGYPVDGRWEGFELLIGKDKGKGDRWCIGNCHIIIVGKTTRLSYSLTD